MFSFFVLNFWPISLISVSPEWLIKLTNHITKIVHKRAIALCKLLFCLTLLSNKACCCFFPLHQLFVFISLCLQPHFRSIVIFCFKILFHYCILEEMAQRLITQTPVIWLWLNRRLEMSNYTQYEVCLVWMCVFAEFPYVQSSTRLLVFSWNK